MKTESEARDEIDRLHHESQRKLFDFLMSREDPETSGLLGELQELRRRIQNLQDFLDARAEALDRTDR